MSSLLPLYVDESTGLAGDALNDGVLQQITPDLPGSGIRAASGTTLSTDPRVATGKIRSTGWGVLWAHDVGDDIKTQLAPLLAHRRAQIGPRPTGTHPDLYQEFILPQGIAANDWLRSFNIDGLTLNAPVQPWLGVPYYLMIVGSPESISFEFQALLRMQWAVGRLWFDEVANFGLYAAAVVDYETRATIDQARTAAVWMTSIPGDRATTQLAQVLGDDFLNSLGGPLGDTSNFVLDPYIGHGKATKKQLSEILTGNCPGGKPAVIFTGTHGLKCTFSATDPTFAGRQAARQGALITQEYEDAATLDASAWIFTGDDVPEDTQLNGTMVFLFSCYSGGCPAGDTYHYAIDGTPIPIATRDFICHLPQVLLSKGALAVIAHVDEAWAYAFSGIDGDSAPHQPQVIRGPLERLMQGQQAGWAVDSLTNTWTQLAAMHDESLPLATGGAAAAPDLARYNAETQAGLYPISIVARNDARNYILLGDPIVALRVDDLQDPCG